MGKKKQAHREIKDFPKYGQGSPPRALYSAHLHTWQQAYLTSRVGFC